MRSRTRHLLAVATAAVMGVVSGCGGGGAPATPTLIKVGVVGPMTGDQAKQGKDMENGVRLAVDRWNTEKGGLLGKKLELLVEDDSQDPKQALNVAWKLVNSGVVGVVGHFNSSCTIPASDIYAKKNVVMITPASTNAQVTERGLKTVFRVCGRDDMQGLVAAQYVASNLPEAKVAIVHDKTTYGQGLADEFRKNYESISGKKAVFYSGIVREDQDFTAVLTDLKSHGPDLIFFGGLYTQTALFVKQAKQLGITARWFSGDGTFDPEYVRIAGKENAEGTLLTFFPDQKKIPTAQAVYSEYQKRFGEVGPYSIYSYIAAQVLFEGIEKAGALEGLKIADSIRGMSFDTAFGRLQFDDKGDVLASPYVVWETRDGEFVQLTGSTPSPAPAESPASGVPSPAGTAAPTPG
jgi:branched-chain amino acid transport system substrate-binding protein